jgi:hypothetical protein
MGRREPALCFEDPLFAAELAEILRVRRGRVNRIASKKAARDALSPRPSTVSHKITSASSELRESRHGVHVVDKHQSPWPRERAVATIVTFSPAKVSPR